ncbi:hypothetical protein [Cohnella endophytica]|uniref:hypothetical protein n=1 Tax=Cohnella endophytica TaxID=2419778 RepID=UPI001314C754|nr:hypothetical protein [Cohnella endophytica]
MTQRRITWSLAAILVLIVVTVFLCEHPYLHIGASAYADKLNLIRDYANQNDWSNSQKMSDNMKKAWKKSQSLMATKCADVDFSILNAFLTELQRAVESRNLHEVGRLSRVSVMLFDQMTSIALLNERDERVPGGWKRA